MLREIKIKELEGFNVFTKIRKEWALITAGSREKFNTMTVNYLTFGYLWRKNVAFVFIKPQRYTYEFTEKNERMTISFFPKELHSVLEYCGAHSGRDVDKVKECKLTPISVGDSVSFNEASLVLTGRKIYIDDFKEDKFLDPSVIASCYPEKDFHRLYVVEIERVYIAE